jgi:hypothetical protein
VHHEDVRRANGSAPRTDRPDLQEALWPILRRGARLLLRSVTKEATVRLEGTGGEAVELGTGPMAVVTGEPLELSLFLFGRKGVAAVELSGDPAAIEVLRKASLGV